MKAADIQRSAEIRAIKEAEAQKLRDLQTSANRDREERRNQFITQLKDLGVVFGSERATKAQYYNAMLADAQRFIQSYRTILNGGKVSATASSGSTSTTPPVGSNIFLPGRAEGGYVSKGIYKMAEDGNPEFVLKGSSTRLAEKMVGGKLTQQNVMSAMQGGGRGQVVWNDYRRFDGQYTSAMKRQVTNDTQAVLKEVFST
mgnify:FL=1